MEEHKTIPREECPHIGEIKITSSDKKQCEDCSLTDHLRLCTTCGAVHCCEDGNAHDTNHYEETGHPIIKAIHENYHFTWCYACDAYLKD